MRPAHRHPPGSYGAAAYALRAQVSQAGKSQGRPSAGPCTEDADRAAEERAAAVNARQADHAARLDRRWTPLDDLCRSAYQAQAALLFVPGAAFDVVPLPPPGDDLPTWPEVRP